MTDFEDSIVDDSQTKQRLHKLDKTCGFVKYKRQGETYCPPRKRVKDWKEVSTRLTESELKCLLHGLWCAVLPIRHWLPCFQRHPQVE